jgi:hypothetical protein
MSAAKDRGSVIMRTPIAVAALGVLLSGCAAQIDQNGLGGPKGDVVPNSVDDAQYRGGRDGSVVVAESRYGHGVVAGPVRRNAYGRLEVRAPGGTWFECGRSCSETLRRETVDFWESRGGRNDPPDGPGYLRFRW